MSKHTPVQIAAEIRGANRAHILAAINGNIPESWTAVQLIAMVIPALEPAEVRVDVTARHRKAPPGMDPEVGAKLTVDAADYDGLKVADRLAEKLRAEIAEVDARFRSLAAQAKGGLVRVALAPGARMPERKTAGAVGYDLCALGDVRIEPGRIGRVPTGVTIELPDGWGGEVRPRSGQSADGIVVVLGTVDSDYRGDLSVILANLSSDPFAAPAGTRIAQLVLARVERPELEAAPIEELTKTARGAGGFGSTGA